MYVGCVAQRVIVRSALCLVLFIGSSAISSDLGGTHTHTGESLLNKLLWNQPSTPALLSLSLALLSR